MINRISSILEDDMEQSDLLEELIEADIDDTALDLCEQFDMDKPAPIHLFSEEG